MSAIQVFVARRLMARGQRAAEHPAALPLGHRTLVESIGEPASVEAVLKRPRPLVVALGGHGYGRVRDAVRLGAADIDHKAIDRCCRPRAHENYGVGSSGAHSAAVEREVLIA
jgi:hypothetical protein